MPYPTLPPRQFFLLDGGGALLSTLLLGVVLVQFESIFGMPAGVLYPLAGIAAVFMVYSLSCYARFPANWRPFLRGIALANLSYCLLTAGLVIYHYPVLSGWGVAYFVGEIALVVGLVLPELNSNPFKLALFPQYCVRNSSPSPRLHRDLRLARIGFSSLSYEKIAAFKLGNYFAP